MLKLSIVTINYNDAAGLKKTIDSVASQQLTDLTMDFQLEHILVDGGSTDGSVDVIKDYESRIAHHQLPISLKWVSEKDKGIYNAMNKGIEIALGKRSVDNSTLPTNHYIQILNSADCLFSPTVIVDMLQALINVHETIGEWPGIMYGNMIRDYGNQPKTVKRNRDCSLGQHEWTMRDFIRGTINHDPTYIRRDLYENYGLYDENLKICSDWKWFVNAVIFGGEKPMYVPIDVTLFDVTGISEKQLDVRERERETELRKMLPEAVLKDYWTWHFPTAQVLRLKKHHLWGVVSFMERVLFKLEKWHILK